MPAIADELAAEFEVSQRDGAACPSAANAKRANPDRCPRRGRAGDPAASAEDGPRPVRSGDKGRGRPFRQLAKGRPNQREFSGQVPRVFLLLAIIGERWKSPPVGLSPRTNREQSQRGINSK